MNLYIKGCGILSAAGSDLTEGLLTMQPTDRLLCKEPDYTAYIPPMQLRRMSKAVRMGIGAAKICLQDASVANADAISVGTAFGCLNDTEIFLSKLVDQDEQMLSPTAFIQSTHNTVAGQIALVTGCMGHNLTYVHRGHSFEHAMINARLYLQAHQNQTILAGAIEELTETSVEILKHTGVYRKEPIVPQHILDNTGEGSIAGEGAAFFAISDHGNNCLQIKDIAVFTAKTSEASIKKVAHFIQQHQIVGNELDLVMLGINGDAYSNEFYTALRKQMFNNVSQAAFKHLCGEYPVSGSFALALIATAAKKQRLPETVILNYPPHKLNRILLINNFLNYYSCWYLEAC